MEGHMIETTIVSIFAIATMFLAYIVVIDR